MKSAIETELRILHLEDSENDAELIRMNLETAGVLCRIVRVQTQKEFSDALAREPIDLVISDFSLPSFNGQEALKITREKLPDAPFIFVSGTIGEDAAIESLLSGATDYVLKHKLSRLVPAVQRAIRESEDRKKRMQAEQQLRESELVYRMMFEDNPLPMWMHDPDTLKFLAVNDAAVDLYGYARDEFLSMTINDLRSSEEGRSNPQEFSEDLHNFGHREPWRHQKKDGTTILIEAVSHEIPFGNKRARIVLANDVTQRKKAEEALRVSEARYRSLFDHMLEGYAFCKMLFENNQPYDFIYVDVNPSFETLTGLKEVVGRRVSEVIPGIRETNPELFETYGRVSLTGLPEKFQTFVPGLGIWFSVSVFSPATGYFVAVFDNITKRKKAEEALRQSEEQHRTLVEGVRDAIFRLSMDAVITSLNPAFEAITGWKREEWIGRTFSDLLHPDDRAYAVEVFRKMIKGEITGVHEYRILRKSGGFVTGEFSTSLQLQDGKPVGVLGIARDVTQQKQLREQLRQAQKLESIGTLAGGIAHDFNNILGIILAYNTFLGRGKHDPQKVAESSDAITKAVERGAGIVRQMLAFARQTDVLLESVDVNNVIGEALKMLGATFPKTIEFVYKLGENIPMVRADRTQLLQVLMNLCVNARDAMPNGGRIVVATGSVSGAEVRQRYETATRDRYVWINVSDTGIGIEEPARKRLFEPFYTTKEPGKGTGLGLSVVYGVVQSHEGFIDVESEVAKGTAFRILLPATSPSGDQERKSKYILESIPGGHETVLLVEDEQALLALVKNVLETKGYHVLTARDGQEAVDFYRHHADQIRVVVTDMGLPKLGGWESARKMRETSKDVKLIFASGYLDSQTREGMAKEGMNHFIQKPYNPNEVLKKIRDVLDGK